MLDETEDVAQEAEQEREAQLCRERGCGERAMPHLTRCHKHIKNCTESEFNYAMVMLLFSIDATLNEMQSMALMNQIKTVAEPT